MANWFKIYETDLDDKRLKWALNKLPEVGWVFIGILSECCKHRSDSIRWSPREHDLFGFADALKVSIPKVNEAVKLLVEIEYIELKNDKIRVIRWNEKQSEYNYRKQRGDYRRVSDNIGDYPLEERRGEDKRGEKGAPPAQNFPEAERPSKEEFFAYFKTQACLLPAEWYILDKWEAALADNWKGKDNWRAYARRVKGWWEADGRPMSPPKKNGKPPVNDVVGGRC